MVKCTWGITFLEAIFSTKERHGEPQKYILKHIETHGDTIRYMETLRDTWTVVQVRTIS